MVGGLEKYLGDGGWSTWETGVEVPGRWGLKYLGEEGWSNWERGLKYLHNEIVKCANHL